MPRIPPSPARKPVHAPVPATLAEQKSDFTAEGAPAPGVPQPPTTPLPLPVPGPRPPPPAQRVPRRPRTSAARYP